MRLQTPRLVLRELEERDGPALQHLDADPEVVRYTPFEVRTLAETQAWLKERLVEAKAEPRRVYELAVARQGEEELLGCVLLLVERPEHREAMLGFNLRRALWGQGLTTEAARAMVGFGFDTLKLHRIWADVDPRNAASVRVVEKLGFTREAWLRENWWLKGEWCDSLIFGLLDREWAA